MTRYLSFNPEANKGNNNAGNHIHNNNLSHRQLFIPHDQYNRTKPNEPDNTCRPWILYQIYNIEIQHIATRASAGDINAYRNPQDLSASRQLLQMPVPDLQKQFRLYYHQTKDSRQYDR
jgi:hypothetical protein